MTDFSILAGMTLARVEAEKGGEEALFVTSDGRIFKQEYSQDCCEHVSIAEIIGDLSDLIGTPITLAEEVSHADEDPEGVTAEPDDYRESWTWTFYKLSTVKGSVTIRWLGESNGYYSEGVDFFEVGA